MWTSCQQEGTDKLQTLLFGHPDDTAPSKFQDGDGLAGQINLHFDFCFLQFRRKQMYNNNISFSDSCSLSVAFCSTGTGVE